MKRLLASLFFVSMFLVAQAQKAGDVVILFDNDVHCAVDGYPVLAGLRDSMEREGCHVAVVSAGDFSSGGLIGTLSHGDAVVRMMNAVGYDAACLGNHEFDMGVAHMLHLDSLLYAPMLSCNFVDMRTGTLPVHPFVVRQYGDVRIAFVGVTTPSTLTGSSPSYFQDSTGRWVYTFSSETLVAQVQRWVDAALASGAHYVVLLSHLGDREERQNSTWLVSQLSGVDVVLDGHDHHVIPGQMMKDKLSGEVLLASTGSKFLKIGMLVIPADGSPMQCRLMDVEILQSIGCTDTAMASELDLISAEYQADGQRVVAESEVDLVAIDAKEFRVSRMQEVNLGNLVADAFRTVLRADVGWMNGGGLRENIAAGEVSHNMLLAAMPYSNRICRVRVTGQALLDALEIAVRQCPVPNGGFPQLSGLRLRIDTTVVSGVELDSRGTFVRIKGPRRVKDVKILQEGRWVPLNPKATYTVAGSEYVLTRGGDAVVFPDSRLMANPKGLPEGATEADVVERYLQENLRGRVTAKLYGSQTSRIRY